MEGNSIKTKLIEWVESWRSENIVGYNTKAKLKMKIMGITQ